MVADERQKVRKALALATRRGEVAVIELGFSRYDHEDHIDTVLITWLVRKPPLVLLADFELSDEWRAAGVSELQVVGALLNRAWKAMQDMRIEDLRANWLMVDSRGRLACIEAAWRLDGWPGGTLVTRTVRKQWVQRHRRTAYDELINRFGVQGVGAIEYSQRRRMKWSRNYAGLIRPPRGLQ